MYMRNLAINGATPRGAGLGRVWPRPFCSETVKTPEWAANRAWWNLRASGLALRKEAWEGG
jgi:hypothetical protein